MRERRRVALASRQVLLARVARREALAALADAAGEEARTARLTARSRALATEYRRTGDMHDGGALRERTNFAGALEKLARNAEQAGEAAGVQVERQAKALNRAETREKRLAERLEGERRVLREIEDRREAPVPQQLARGLHKTSQTMSSQTPSDPSGQRLSPRPGRSKS